MQKTALGNRHTLVATCLAMLAKLLSHSACRVRPRAQLVPVRVRDESRSRR
jgi:hypothetical protein